MCMPNIDNTISTIPSDGLEEIIIDSGMGTPAEENPPHNENNPHPLITPNFLNPMARVFPPNFYNIVMGLSEEYNVPAEYVFMVMCGHSEDFIAMAEDIIQTPLGQPVEYVMPYPLDVAWKYLMDTKDPSLGSDSEGEQTTQAQENPIPMDYVRHLLRPVRIQLLMKEIVSDQMQSSGDNFVFPDDLSDSDTEIPPTP